MDQTDRLPWLREAIVSVDVYAPQHACMDVHVVAIHPHASDAIVDIARSHGAQVQYCNQFGRASVTLRIRGSIAPVWAAIATVRGEDPALPAVRGAAAAAATTATTTARPIAGRSRAQIMEDYGLDAGDGVHGVRARRRWGRTDGF
jgi:hypothetical protein